MINKKEIITILITTILLAFAISLFNLKESFYISLISIFIIIILNVFAKKITAYYYDSEIEIKFWEIKRYGFKPFLRSNKSIPIWAFLPIIIKIITLGVVDWTAAYIFDIKAKTYRAAKRHGLYSFTEISERQIAIIASMGIIINLIFALIGYLIGQTNFASLSLGFAFFNMLPISNLDGNKIFFGMPIFWVFLATIVLLGALASILII